ncbi:MAG: hypothetical protein FJ096_11820, partial [Deltaproteobacteria bacterium]|nr:hypothetical protein [Deltaproteobacteria bacterium]
APPGGGGYGPPGGGGYGPPGGGGYGPPGGGGYGPPGGGYGPPGYGPPGHGQPQGFGPPGAPPAAGGGKGKLVAIVLVALLIVAVLVGLLLFILGGGKSKSAALDHLPKGCDVAARMDVKGLLTVPAIEKHVIPALEDNAKQKENAGRIAKLLVTARLNPKTDIDDVAVCVSGLEAVAAGGKGDPEVLFAMGGNFGKNAIVDAIAAHAKPEKLTQPKERDGLRVIETKDSNPTLYITQASDGALLAATSLELLKKAANNSASNYKFPNDQIALVVPADAAKRLAKSAPSQVGIDLSAVGRGEATVHLSPGKIGARLELGAAAGSAALQANLLLPAVRSGPGVPANLRSTVDGLVVKADGNDLVIEAPIASDTIDAGAEAVAKEIRRANDGS